MNKRKHYNEIVAWAEGKQIQAYTAVTHTWEDVYYPTWYADCEYRIKPEPKKDVVQYAVVDNVNYVYAPRISIIGPYNDNPENNIKLVFDGETGKLKEAAVINYDKEIPF